MKRIIKGDKVRVTTGKWKGSEGTVLEVLTKTNQVIVEKVNLAKRHLKAGKAQNQESGMVEKEAPIHVSNVTLVDAKSKDVYTKVSFQLDKNNHKVRVNRKTNATIAKAK